MMPLLSILLLGFFLGMRHATDADHVVAITTIVGRDRSLLSAARIGTLWGAGHTAMILVVGGAIVAFGLVIPPRVGLALELSVGLMLIVLGALNLRRQTLPAHHAGDNGHMHRHATLPPGAIARPLLIGTVHGLAGSGAVALLVLSTIRSPAWAIGYLIIFGLGTVVGMMLITVALSIPFAIAAPSVARTQRALTVGASLASVGFGVFLVYRIGFVDGLFTSNPHWVPG